MFVKIDKDGFYQGDLPFYRGEETDNIKLRDDAAGPFNRWLWQAGQWIEGAPKTAEILAVETAVQKKALFNETIRKRLGDSGTQIMMLNKTLLLVIEALAGNLDAKAALDAMLPDIRAAFDYDSAKLEVKGAATTIKEVAVEVYGGVVPDVVKI
jgi:hypothetical protein